MPTARERYIQLTGHEPPAQTPEPPRKSATERYQELTGNPPPSRQSGYEWKPEGVLATLRGEPWVREEIKPILPQKLSGGAVVDTLLGGMQRRAGEKLGAAATLSAKQAGMPDWAAASWGTLASIAPELADPINWLPIPGGKIASSIIKKAALKIPLKMQQRLFLKAAAEVPMSSLRKIGAEAALREQWTGKALKAPLREAAEVMAKVLVDKPVAKVAKPDLPDALVPTVPKLNKPSSGPAKELELWRKKRGSDIAQEDWAREIELAEANGLIYPGERAMLLDRGKDLLPRQTLGRDKALPSMIKRRYLKEGKAIEAEGDRPVAFFEEVMRPKTRTERVVAAYDSALSKINPWLGRFSKMAREVLVPFTNVPSKILALERRQLFHGREATINRAMRSTTAYLEKLPLERQRKIAGMVTKRLPRQMLDDADRVIADKLIRQTDVAGRMLVKANVLTQAQFDANEGQFFHYMYLHHILGADKMGQVMKAGGNRSAMDAFKTYARAKGNLSYKEQKALGFIEEISVVHPHYMQQALSDLNKSQYFKWLLKNQAHKGSYIEKGGKIYTLDDVKRDTRNFADELSYHTQAGDTAAAKQASAKLDEFTRYKEKLEGIGANIPEGFKQMPSGKGWGPLSGAIMPRGIVEDVKRINGWLGFDAPDAVKSLARLNAAGMSAWKIMKIPLNLPTLSRNIISNMGQLVLSGIPPWEVPLHMARGIRHLVSKDDVFKAARARGLFRTNIAQTELRDLLRTVDEYALSSKTNLFTGAGKFLKGAAKFYGHIDDFYKMTKFSAEMSKGATADAAAREANKWIMDYGLIHPWVAFGRQTFAPVVTYQTKIAPLIGEALVERPHYAIPLLTANTIGSLAVAKKIKDISQVQFDKLMKELPGFIRESGSFMLTPFEDEDGNFRWVNTEYMAPWGNLSEGMSDVIRGISTGDSGLYLGGLGRMVGLGHPAYDFAKSFMTGTESEPPRETFTGKTLYNTIDSPKTKLVKTVEAMGNMVVGSAMQFWNPRSPTSKAIRAWQEKPSATGKPESKAWATARLFGINSYVPSRTRAIYEQDRAIRVADSELSSILGSKITSDAEKKAARIGHARRIEEIQSSDPDISKKAVAFFLKKR